MSISMPSSGLPNSLSCILEERGKIAAMEEWRPNKLEEEGDYSSDYNNYVSEKDEESDKPPQEQKSLHHRGPPIMGMTDSSQTTEPTPELVEAEVQSELMNRFRILLMIGLGAVLLVCSIGGYFLARQRDLALFHSEFRSYSEAVASSITSHVDGKFDVLDSLSTSLTTYAASKESSWPFVTLANSGQLLGKYLELSRTDAITILPLVTAEKRLLWEVYSVRLQGWISEEIARKEGHLMEENDRKLSSDDRMDDEPNTSRPTTKQDHSWQSHSEISEVAGVGHVAPAPHADLQSQWSRRQSFFEGTNENTFPDSSNFSGPTISAHIIGADGEYDRGRGPFLASWQYAPVGNGLPIVNINMLATPEFERDYSILVDQKKAVLSEVFTRSGGDTDEYHGIESSLHTLLQENNETSLRYSNDEPFGFIIAPVRRSLDPESSTVAVVTAMFQWRSLLGTAVPKAVTDIDIVIEHSRGQKATFHVAGGQVLYAGESDMHETKFDSHRVTLQVQRYISSTDQTLTNGTGSIVFSIYPSSDLKKRFRTRVPLSVSISMALVLALSLFVFWVYDSIVEYRHDLVLDKVTKTEAVISNVFPKHVVDRLVGNAASVVSDDFPLVSISCARRGSLFGNESVHSGVSVGGAASRRGSLASRRLSMDSVISGIGRPSTRRVSMDSAAGFQRRLSTGFRRMSLAASDGTASRGDAPIADFYPETSVFFADIKGFTAWCSEREPGQVFALLESIYNSFDAIAARKSVYKVETIGGIYFCAGTTESGSFFLTHKYCILNSSDCYMAVTGLPTPNPHHALVICEFARECLAKMRGLVKDLEIFLGPGTGSLDLRIGIHSGPVVAGVLRTGNARFQLFGDTVNTAARMESTGYPGKIQISQSTAECLERMKCGHWCNPRDDRVFAKGKGRLQTYWLHTESLVNSMASDVGKSIQEEDSVGTAQLPSRRLSPESYRLVEWMADRLGYLLKKIETWHTMHVFPLASSDLVMKEDATLVVPEIKEILFFPTNFGVQYSGVEEVVEVDSKVTDQLLDLVHAIALLYPENPFHNLAHASHVTMSVIKLLARVSLSSKENREGAAAVIASDPLTQFACVFAALIHDVGHPGVPNTQLVTENTEMAIKYDGKCVAESNSVNIAWGLLMKDTYKDLRRAMFCNEDEMKRFRQLVVNLVIATDIVDPDLKALRDDRWAKVFDKEETDVEEGQSSCGESEDYGDYHSDYQRLAHDVDRDDIGRRATIVIEHLILASDVSHMMQHFQVYLKWNGLFFQECVEAFQAGRSKKDPSLSWYKGELWFFDNYIIPLASRLKDCGAFGVSSDEYLNFALQNRQEWNEKGEEIVASLIAKYM